MNRFDEFNMIAAVAKNGNFSSAARALRLSPSAISKMVNRIEDRLKIRLFDRTSKFVMLTREGELYLSSITRVLNAIQEVDELAESLIKVPHGTIRIHTSPAFAQGQIAPILPEFLARYTSLKFELRVGPKFFGLTEDTDIAIQFGELADSSLVARRIAASKRVVCASPLYLERAGVPTKPSELATHQLLNYSMPERDAWPFVKEGVVTRVPINSKVVVDQAGFLLGLVLDGVGIARLPGYMIAKDLEEGRLVELFTPYTYLEGIYAIYRARKNLSPRLRLFIEYIRRKLSAQDWNLDRNIIQSN
ncbi:LysR family transcriptional regulator [Propylenella binzhouense]|uniref:LysR family transcriptional regulator n=1 Tax=Propylenella binzhouense TaxID=2555902 RepID=A0A964WSG8_9HYPH|nr:LysR family transcriptional regulator [Propylenella binzhouense]MYZ46851.1 LysR family transcriptional regulator [Propylenella binzhouense]